MVGLTLSCCTKSTIQPALRRGKVDVDIGHIVAITGMGREGAEEKVLTLICMFSSIVTGMCFFNATPV
jgi:hypothetical protein